MRDQLCAYAFGCQRKAHNVSTERAGGGGSPIQHVHGRCVPTLGGETSREGERRINLSSRQAVVFRWGRLKAEYSLASGFTGLARLDDPAEYASPREAGSRAGSTVQKPKIILQVVCLCTQRARILIYACFDLSEYFKHDAENNLRTVSVWGSKLKQRLSVNAVHQYISTEELMYKRRTTPGRHAIV